ncbi:hypothetical protein [Thermogutta sp.]|uniref:hypothetical protein n=1 Tax=Thermogutta sp. TaxID=1962930 RepID=UPI00321FC91E
MFPPQIVVSLLIVGVAAEVPKSPPAPSALPQPDLSIVYRCNFDESHDQNYDSFPDYWTRAKGPRYPLYVKAEIAPVASPDSPRSLWGYLDGGSLALSTPPISITQLFSYEAQVWVRTRNVQNDRIFLEVTLLDSNDKPLRLLSSRQLAESPEWTLLTVGPFDVDDRLVANARLTLHVEAGARADVGAEVWFGAISLRRLPMLKVSLDRPSGLYLLPQQPRVDCVVSGVLSPSPPLQIRVIDAEEQELLREEISLETQPAFREEDIPPEAALREVTLYRGAAQRTLPLKEPGYYRLQVHLVQDASSSRDAELAFVIMRPPPRNDLASFGWSLPRGVLPAGPDRLRELLHHAAVGYVKFPVWCDENPDKRTLQETSHFLEHLASHGVQIVGLLTPPDGVREKVSPHATVLDVLSSDPKIWQPSLEFTFARVATLVRYWQLGEDDTEPPPGFARIQEVLNQAQRSLGNVVAEIRVGIPWNWLHPLPPINLSFVHLTGEPPLTAEELESFLREVPQNPAPPQIFLSLRPLDDRNYSLRDRVRDLVLRMAATREGAALAAFHPDPFDPHTGLCTARGTPTVLYLPWRTTAHALASAQPIGSVLLPGGSSNRIFSIDRERGVMVLWANRPTRECLHLGSEITALDVWGREVPVEETPVGQAILVGHWPLFVYGVSVPIARWRQRVALATTRLPSVYGVPFRNQLRFENTFLEPVSGEAFVTTPPHWQVSPRHFTFQLQPGEKLEREVFFTLPFDAETGPQPVRVDFRVQGQSTYRFSSYHFVEVGLGDVYIEVSTRLDESGDLVVQQVFVNETEYPVSFRCELFAPDRRRQFMFIREQGPGRTVHQYRFSRGKELIGKTLWLRAEEIGGSRTLNYRITAAE